MIFHAMSGTTSETAKGFLSVTQTIVPSFNAKALSIHQGRSNFLSCGIIDLLCSGSRNLHIGSAFLLGKTLFVDQTNTLIFIHRKNNIVSILTDGSKH